MSRSLPPVASHAVGFADRWVGILHVCLHRGQLYDETTAWQHLRVAAAA